MFIVITTEGPNDTIRASNAAAKKSGSNKKEKAGGSKIKTFQLISERKNTNEKIYDLEDGRYRKEKWLVKDVRSKQYYEIGLYRQLDANKI